MPRGYYGGLGDDPFVGVGPGSAAANRLIGQGQGAGFFDPLGSPFLKARRRRAVMRNARNRRRHGELSASLYGLDPSQQRSALFGLDRDISGRVSDALNEGDFAEMRSNQDWFRDLLMGQTRFEQERELERERAKRDARDQRRGFWGGLAGKVVSGLSGGAYP